jgi:GntR family transcriptional regulator
MAKRHAANRSDQDAAHQLGRMSVDTASPTPLYHQIFAQLRDAISKGGFADEKFLPSEQEISQHFGVSRITAKRALDELAAAGLVVREQGRGTRINATPGRTIIRGGISGLIQSLHANARHSVKLIDFGYVRPPTEVSALLGVDERAKVQRAIRVWNGPNGPFSHLTTFVPEHIGRKWTKTDLQTKPMISLLQSRGMRLGRAQEQITATTADRSTAQRLLVRRGAPLLMIVRTVFDVDGVAVEHIVALYPPARYQYLISLE